MVGGYIDHTMIRVEDREESVEWYREMFDWVVHRESGGESFDLIFVGPEDADGREHLIELTYNHPDPEPREYEMGDAWGHFAVAVDDVSEAYEELMERGVEDYRDPDSCGGHYAFVRDPDGHEIELVERGDA